MGKNINFKNMISKRNKSRQKKYKNKKYQMGGVGFKLDVNACPIGGRPPVTATSDCPDVGPGSLDFANALYNFNKQNGGTKKRHNKKQSLKHKSKNRCGYKLKKKTNKSKK